MQRVPNINLMHVSEIVTGTVPHIGYRRRFFAFGEIIRQQCHDKYNASLHLVKPDTGKSAKPR